MISKHETRYFYNTDEVEREADNVGSHWFEPATLGFFRGRVGYEVYGGRYFVSSEQGGRDIWGGQRRYTVREVRYNDEGRFSINTVGEFGEYDTRAQAHGAAKRMGSE